MGSDAGREAEGRDEQEDRDQGGDERPEGRGGEGTQQLEPG